jgi:hypothetical protein
VDYRSAADCGVAGEDWPGATRPGTRDNDIDVSVLPRLTEADLEKVGVSLGHRRKMLVAIAELSNSAQAPQQSTLTRSKPEDAAERRQAMFSDLQAAKP